MAVNANIRIPTRQAGAALAKTVINLLKLLTKNTAQYIIISNNTKEILIPETTFWQGENQCREIRKKFLY